MGNRVKKTQWYPPHIVSLQNDEHVKIFERFTCETPKASSEEEITYFGSKLKRKPFQMTNEVSLAWDPKKKKDNSTDCISVRNNIFNQEKDKPVPAVSSFQYGRLKRYDMPSGEFRRSSFQKAVIHYRSGIHFETTGGAEEFNKTIF